MRSWRMYPPPRRGCQVSQLWSPHAAEGTPTAERFSLSKRMGMYHKGYVWVWLKMLDTPTAPTYGYVIWYVRLSDTPSDLWPRLMDILWYVDGKNHGNPLESPVFRRLRHSLESFLQNELCRFAGWSVSNPNLQWKCQRKWGTFRWSMMIPWIPSGW